MSSVIVVVCTEDCR
jgi:hypothetical protein